MKFLLYRKIYFAPPLKKKKEKKSNIFFFPWIGGGWSRNNFCIYLCSKFTKWPDCSFQKTMTHRERRWTCLRDYQERTDLQISQERLSSYLATDLHEKGLPDCIKPLSRAALQEKTTQCKEHAKLMISAQDLFYNLDIILKFKSDKSVLGRRAL